ncbi:MAG: hypothetical protein NT075_37655 [Chloroflexi bacterium]|nr:hypothetical protein [Chloroflexota bacterium]
MNVTLDERSLTKVELNDVVSALFKLPAEQIATVYDFILFLQMRHGQPIDESDSWTEEDVNELRAASLQYAAVTILANDQEFH